MSHLKACVEWVVVFKRPLFVAVGARTESFGERSRQGFGYGHAQ